MLFQGNCIRPTPLNDCATILCHLYFVFILVGYLVQLRFLPEMQHYFLYVKVYTLQCTNRQIQKGYAFFIFTRSVYLVLFRCVIRTGIRFYPHLGSCVPGLVIQQCSLDWVIRAYPEISVGKVAIGNRNIQ